MKTITQICLLVKRILCKPIMVLVLLIVPVCTLIVKLLPDDMQSTEIVSGIYVDSPTERSAALLDYLTNTSTGFTFREYSSSDILKDAVASGDIDSGYELPAGFEDSFAAGNGEVKITVYTTAATSFREVTTESVYAALLRTYAPDIASDMLAEDYVNYISSAYGEYSSGGETASANSDYKDTDIAARYEKYLAEDVFTINTDVSGTYKPIDSVRPDNIPVNLMVYIIIVVCALLGLQNYMRDMENGVYSAQSRRTRSSFCAKNIAAGVIPAAISGIISILIYTGGREAAAPLLGLLAVSVCIIPVCCLLRCIFRSYRAYSIALPYIIIGLVLLSVICYAAKM